MTYEFNPREWAAAAMMLVEEKDDTFLADLTLLCIAAMSPESTLEDLDFKNASQEITGEVTTLSPTELTMHFGFMCLRLAEEFYANNKVEEVPGRAAMFNLYANEIKRRLKHAHTTNQGRGHQRTHDRR